MPQFLTFKIYGGEAHWPGQVGKYLAAIRCNIAQQIFDANVVLCVVDDMKTIYKLWAIIKTDAAATFAVGFTCGAGFLAVVIDVAVRQ